MLSARGHCHTFEASADGYVRAEGCCAVFIQTASSVGAVQVASTSLNQDGRTANLTSPNGPAQQRVIARALQLAVVQGSELPLVDCHGTGTALGDPIEVSAQRAVLGQGRREADPLVMGAVKSSVGHLEAGAGLVGVLKVVLALEHWQAAPNMHLQRLNPHIDAAGYAAVLPSGMLAAVASGDMPMVAGTSSFGFGGTNSHALLASQRRASSCIVRAQQMQYQHSAFVWWDTSSTAVQLRPCHCLECRQQHWRLAVGRSGSAAGHQPLAVTWHSTAWAAHQWHQALATCAWCVRR